MPRDRMLMLAALLPALCAAQPAPVAFHSFTYTGRDTIFEQALPAGHYRNPILTGFHPDPSILRTGDDYFLVTSTFAYFPGIPVFHSRDLVNWRQVGHAIDRAGQLRYDGLGVSRGIFAPAISHHEGTYYLTSTMVDAGGNFLITASTPAGPWSDPLWLGFDGIDPSLFFDDDGRAWMLNNGAPEGPPLYDGHRALWIQEFDIAAKKLVGPRTLIVSGGVDLATKPIWIEGPHIFRKDHWYYLTAAEGGTSIRHSQVILRSRSVTGPYVPWEKNPILTQRDLDGTALYAVTCTGHAEFVIGPDGRWWAAFLGCRPFAGHYWLTGRETYLLPVEWTADGWPVILPMGERVPFVVKAPARNRVEVGAGALGGDPPLSGNFTAIDRFDQPELPPAWFMLRTPKEMWWKFAGGRLNLTPRRDGLSGRGNPSFYARRVQHAKFDASAKLDVPMGAGISAGIVAFQNETHHYYFAVQRTAGGLTAMVEKWNGAMAEIVAARALPADLREIELRISGDEKLLAFTYAVKPGEWTTLLPGADALAISVQAAGGGLHFTGAVVGIHTRID